MAIKPPTDVANIAVFSTVELMFRMFQLTSVSCATLRRAHIPVPVFQRPSGAKNSVPGVYSTRILVGGFGRLNETLTLFKTQKMYILIPCLRESAVIFYPVQGLIKHHRIQSNKNGHKFAFHASQQRHTKSAKIMWLRGQERRRFSGTTLFRQLS